MGLKTRMKNNSSNKSGNHHSGSIQPSTASQSAAIANASAIVPEPEAFIDHSTTFQQNNLNQEYPSTSITLSRGSDLIPTLQPIEEQEEALDLWNSLKSLQEFGFELHQENLLEGISPSDLNYQLIKQAAEFKKEKLTAILSKNAQGEECSPEESQYLFEFLQPCNKHLRLHFIVPVFVGLALQDKQFETSKVHQIIDLQVEALGNNADTIVAFEQQTESLEQQNTRLKLEMQNLKLTIEKQNQKAAEKDKLYTQLLEYNRELTTAANPSPTSSNPIQLKSNTELQSPTEIMKLKRTHQILAQTLKARDHKIESLEQELQQKIKESSQALSNARQTMQATAQDFKAQISRLTAAQHTTPSKPKPLSFIPAFQSTPAKTPSPHKPASLALTPLTPSMASNFLLRETEKNKRLLEKNRKLTKKNQEYCNEIENLTSEIEGLKSWRLKIQKQKNTADRNLEKAYSEIQQQKEAYSKIEQQAIKLQSTIIFLQHKLQTIKNMQSIPNIEHNHLQNQIAQLLENPDTATISAMNSIRDKAKDSPFSEVQATSSILSIQGSETTLLLQYIKQLENKITLLNTSPNTTLASGAASPVHHQEPKKTIENLKAQLAEHQNANPTIKPDSATENKQARPSISSQDFNYLTYLYPSHNAESRETDAQERIQELREQQRLKKDNEETLENYRLVL